MDRRSGEWGSEGDEGKETIVKAMGVRETGGKVLQSNMCR